MGRMWRMATLVCCQQEFRLESDLHSNLAITIYPRRAYHVYCVTPRSGRSGNLTSPPGLSVAQCEILCIRDGWKVFHLPIEPLQDLRGSIQTRVRTFIWCIPPCFLWTRKACIPSSQCQSLRDHERRSWPMMEQRRAAGAEKWRESNSWSYFDSPHKTSPKISYLWTFQSYEPKKQSCVI